MRVLSTMIGLNFPKRNRKTSRYPKRLAMPAKTNETWDRRRIISTLPLASAGLILGCGDKGDKILSSTADEQFPSQKTATSFYGRWIRMPGILSQIAVSRGGSEVWGVNPSGYIYKWLQDFGGPANGRWRLMPGRLDQISVGDDGTIWGIRAQSILRWKWDDPTNPRISNGTWINVPGSLTKVVVGERNKIFGIREGLVWKWQWINPNAVDEQQGIWIRLPRPGWLSDIDTSRGGPTIGVDSNDQIHWYKGNGEWGPIPGRIKRISVSFWGTPARSGQPPKSGIWAVQDDGDIFRLIQTKYTPQQGPFYRAYWEKVPGTLHHVAVGIESQHVWGTRDNIIFRWVPS